jgi:hypothetical protein
VGVSMGGERYGLSLCIGIDVIECGMSVWEFVLFLNIVQM